MEAGDIIRFALQQDDGQFVKRPALILKKVPPYNDYIICGISKSIGLAQQGLDVVISRDDPDFATWGLDYPGVIRAGFLFTVSTKYIEGTLGSISTNTHRTILNNLSSFLLA